MIRRFYSSTVVFVFSLLLVGVGFFWTTGIPFHKVVLAKKQSAQPASPTITSITPNQTPKGTVPAKIRIAGTGLVAGSKVLFNQREVIGKVKPTTKKLIIKDLPADLLVEDRTYDVAVVTPEGLRSNTVSFKVGTGVGRTPSDIEITEPNSLLINTNAPTQLRVRVLDGTGVEIPNPSLTFETEDQTLASITAEGKLTALGPGVVAIRIRSGELSKTFSFQISSVATVSSGIFAESDMVLQGTTIFASDFANHVIRRSQAFQPMSDFAGRSGLSGDTDGTGESARFNAPLGIGLRNGTVYLVDTANRAIRQIEVASGSVKTILTEDDLVAAGLATSWEPRDIEIDGNEDLFITDAANHVIWQATPKGNGYRLGLLAGTLGQAGTLDGTGVSAQFDTPQRLTLVGRLLSVTQATDQIRQVALPGGAVKTIQSQIGVRRSDTALPLTDPRGITADADGTLYVAVPGNVKVVTIVDEQVTVRDLLPPGTVAQPVAVALDETGFYILDRANGQLVRAIFGKPAITTLAPPQVTAGNGSTEITIQGKNFSPGTQVFVGSDPVSIVKVVSPTQLQFTLPPQLFGESVTIRVRTSGGVTATTLNITGPNRPDAVSLEGYPESRSLKPGEQTTFTINIQRVNFTGSVGLSVSGLPTGVTAQFLPNPAISETAKLVVTASQTVPAGTFSLQVRGTASGVSVQSAVLSLGVNVDARVILGATPTFQTVTQGKGTFFNISLSRTNYTGTVNFSVTGAPAGSNPFFTLNQITGNSTSLRLELRPDVVPGTYQLKIEGTGAGEINVVPVVVTMRVLPIQPSVRLIVEPPQWSVLAGQGTTYLVILNRTEYLLPIRLKLEQIGGSQDAGVEAVLGGNDTTAFRLPAFVTSSPETPPGAYRFRITGTAEGAIIYDSNDFVFNVVPPPPIVQLSVDPLSQTVVQGQSTSYDVTITKVNYTGDVALIISGEIPPGTQIAPTPTGFQDRGLLQVRTSADTPVGEYQLFLNGLADGVGIQSIPFRLIVEAPSGVPRP
ncbi:MAG: IPT/TIG domain-containing protein [Acidobacteria bacterium]|nr:IPT/TIG domain-containing protein [Acidobacteriota bacterium]